MTIKYQVILADPPWWYNNRKTGGERKNKTKFGGGARKHYPLMKDEELLAMASQVEAIADKNCIFFLWCTGPRLDFAITLLQHWGFRYCTIGFTWIKLNKTGTKPIYGPGYYTASNTELVLIGIKGSMRPTKKMLPSVIHHSRMKHSKKPDLSEALTLMYPNTRKVELFAREKRPGWDAWGNEIESDISF